MSDRATPPGSGLERICRALIRMAAIVVPSARRMGWREEWESEIWHHLNGKGDGHPAASTVTLIMRCLGAFPHAVWIRREEFTVDTVLQDVRFALRTLTRRPAFALVAIVTLALGIGGNTAVFSVVNAILLRSLPLPTADRLVFVWGREFNGAPAAAVSPADYLDFVDNTRAFEELAAIAAFSEQSVYRGGDRPVGIVSQAVTHNLLQTLGAQPALGRGFNELGELIDGVCVRGGREGHAQHECGDEVAGGDHWDSSRE